ncbi:MAG: ribosome rescue protein RqcH [Candidatus Hodarchaeales archaeon]
MSSLDVYVIVKELQNLIGYRVENLYRDSTDKFYLFKFKGFGKYRNPFLLIEPGYRIHITEYRHVVPERPTEKVMAIRKHLKGSELIGVKQVDFDRLIFLEFSGKQEYRVYIELFGTKPNFVIVGDKNQVISALWYKRMRHRDLLPGKQYELPPSRGVSIFDVSLKDIIECISLEEEQNQEIIKTLVRKIGGGGALMEEILFRAEIPKGKKVSELDKSDIERIIIVRDEIKEELETLKPIVLMDSENVPIAYYPIQFKSVKGSIKSFPSYSEALDFYYSSRIKEKPLTLLKNDKKRVKYEKILEKQRRAIKGFEKKEKRYRSLGDLIYENFNLVEELLSTIVTARKNNLDWDEIKRRMAQAKAKKIPSALILEKIHVDRGTVEIKLESEKIEVDFRKTASELANEFYEKAKKSSRKIEPAKNAMIQIEKKLESISEDIFEQEESAKITLKRRKRKWYEKYHWAYSSNGFLIIGGKDVSSNEELAKRRMDDSDLFFHADLKGAPYTILKTKSSENELTNEDIMAAAKLAACFSSAWKAGYGAIDVYYVKANNVSFSAPSGEYIPKGGIMVRGNRTYVKGVELSLAIGIEFDESNAKVIYGTKEFIEKTSPVVIILKPGSEPKGKLAKKIQKIIVDKLDSVDDKVKAKAIDLNEFVHAIPYDSQIVDVYYSSK